MVCFKASGLSVVDWLAIPPLDRGQLVAHQAQKEQNDLQADAAARNLAASTEGKDALQAETKAQNKATARAADAVAKAMRKAK